MPIKHRENHKIIFPEGSIELIEKGLCPQCLKPQTEWKRSPNVGRCCSKECTEKFNKTVFWGWQQLRRAVIKRDGKCVQCGIIHTYERELTEYDTYYREYEIIISEKPSYKSEKHNLTVTPVTLLDMTKYVADHIHPIALGGNEWDINNIQTLCIQCNRQKTRKDIKNISIERKIPAEQTRL